MHKNLEKKLFFVGILTVTDENSRIRSRIRFRIRIHLSKDTRIRIRIRSAPKCHGSRTLSVTLIKMLVLKMYEK